MSNKGGQPLAQVDLSALRERLGVSGGALPVLDGLDQADVERLCGLVDKARQRQGKDLESASEEALKHVPALLRGAVRKLLFG